MKDSQLKQFIKNSYKQRQRGIYYSESDPGWREAVWRRGPSLNCLGPLLQSGLTMKPQCFISKRLWKCDPISLQQTSKVSDGAPLCGCCSHPRQSTDCRSCAAIYWTGLSTNQSVSRILGPSSLSNYYLTFVTSSFLERLILEQDQDCI